MMISRTDIEKALDELISNEEGMRFQGLAVVLAKQKWPDLIASERKKDLGLDAHAPALLARDGKGRGLACSLTATLEKIKDDVEKIRRHADDVTVLVFATPRSVTKSTITKWANAVEQKYSIGLIVVSREDIITDLMVPSNVPICRTHLGIPVAVDPELDELLEKTREAISETAAALLAHPRLSGRPKIALRAVKLDQEGRETEEVVDLTGLQVALREGHRLVLEAPAGRGKTTTLIQLVKRCGDGNELAFPIELPAWIRSNIDLLEFIASMPAFRSRDIHADDLAKAYGAVHCMFLLNGWNEISDRHSENAVVALAHLERTFPRAGIIVATRTHHTRPPLPGSSRAKLLSLSRQQRAEYLEKALQNRAEQLRVILDGDPVLDELTRTPFILAEVTTLFLSGVPIPKTKVGVLTAVMQLIEQADEHQNYLKLQPVAGHSRDYLTDLGTEMTAQGDVALDETHARRVVHSVSLRLNATGQIANLPEPAAILNTLCAHHILERFDYPSVGFRFEHQQFQEFYAALGLKRQLWDIVDKNDRNQSRGLVRDYVNIPVWEEPFRMIAEEIGELSGEGPCRTIAVTAGKHLIELVLAIDPVFAAELSRLSGDVVWAEVRSAMSERLRAWYQVSDEHHRRCALAGMLATGSDEFIDIVLPLLNDDDRQTRLNAYRPRGELHVTSLGKEWRQVVKNWKEEQRADFIGDVVGESSMADIAEEFALTDSSPRVRAAAIHALEWIDDSEALSRVLTTFDAETFENLLRDRVIDTIPAGLKPRALLTYEKFLQKADDSRERLRVRLKQASLGAEHNLERLKEDLTKWPLQQVTDTDRWLLTSVLEILRKADPQWVSHWTAARIANGLLWADRWITFLTTIPEDLKRELLEKISDTTGKEISKGAVSVLAATADTDLAADVFCRSCIIREQISAAAGEYAQNLWKASSRLQELFRTISPNIAVSGMLSHLSREFNEIEYRVMIELFGSIGGEDSDLRSVVEEDHRQRLRKYLKEGLPFALNQDDFNGNLKASLALALARVGERSDMDDVHRLIQADIDRWRRGQEALLKGESGPLTHGAHTSWANSYVRADLGLIRSELKIRF